VDEYEWALVAALSSCPRVRAALVLTQSSCPRGRVTLVLAQGLCPRGRVALVVTQGRCPRVRGRVFVTNITAIIATAAQNTCRVVFLACRARGQVVLHRYRQLVVSFARFASTRGTRPPRASLSTRTSGHSCRRTVRVHEDEWHSCRHRVYVHEDEWHSYSRHSGRRVRVYEWALVLVLPVKASYRGSSRCQLDGCPAVHRMVSHHSTPCLHASSAPSSLAHRSDSAAHRTEALRAHLEHRCAVTTAGTDSALSHLGTACRLCQHVISGAQFKNVLVCRARGASRSHAPFPPPASHTSSAFSTSTST
jgi:hypothetical protein